MSNKERIILHFTLPKDPSSVSVGVWRKSEKYGSIGIGQYMQLPPLPQKTRTEISKEINKVMGPHLF